MPPTDQPTVDQTVSRFPRSSFWATASRRALLGLPLATMCVIGFAVFVVGAPRSYVAARVWGGPTDRVKTFTARLQAVERIGELERPLARAPLVVESSSGLQVAGRWEGLSDASGFAEISIPLRAHGAQSLRVMSGDEVLASGPVRLSVARWQRSARQRGSWLRNAASQPLEIEVRPGRGVFAVPFSDPLMVSVKDQQGPVTGAHLSLRFEGVLEPTGTVALTTNASGLAHCSVAPAEHVVTLEVQAASGDRHARWFSTLPVVPGALHATRHGQVLSIASAVPRDAAFFTVVSNEARLFGGHVMLKPTPRGGAAARVSLPPGLPDDPLWAVVSSEPDLVSSSAVGWPLGSSVETFDVPEVLLLDGLPAAYERSRETPRRARSLAAWFALLAALLVLVLLTGRVRAADRALGEHFDSVAPEDARKLRSKQPVLALLTALLCIALGFVIVTLIALSRID